MRRQYHIESWNRDGERERERESESQSILSYLWCPSDPALAYGRVKVNLFDIGIYFFPVLKVAIWTLAKMYHEMIRIQRKVSNFLASVLIRSLRSFILKGNVVGREKKTPKNIQKISYCIVEITNSDRHVSSFNSNITSVSSFLFYHIECHP